MSTVPKSAIALLGFLLLQITVQAQAAPSFDCSKASTRVERMICDHPRIAQLDSELSDAYPSLPQRRNGVLASHHASKPTCFARHVGLVPAWVAGAARGLLV